MLSEERGKAGMDLKAPPGAFKRPAGVDAPAPKRTRDAEQIDSQSPERKKKKKKPVAKE